MKRFNHMAEKMDHEKNIITYVGTMGGNKDGLENLIEAMAIVKEKDKNVRLQLIGTAPDKDLNRLKNKVAALGLTETINFLGKKKVEEIPCLLSNSNLLVLARPDNNQAKAGFPTKLGEYLASSIPVVITITGEIPKYLKDNVSAYLAKPDDINDFANKVIYALSDKNSEAIGKRGYEVADKNFNYELYGKEILRVLEC
jgi:glycosyltransferase involved in cell wall biosynthesis